MMKNEKNMRPLCPNYSNYPEKWPKSFVPSIFDTIFLITKAEINAF